jgi:hypothetical protein
VRCGAGTIASKDDLIDTLIVDPIEVARISLIDTTGGIGEDGGKVNVGSHSYRFWWIGYVLA